MLMFPLIDWFQCIRGSLWGSEKFYMNVTNFFLISLKIKFVTLKSKFSKNHITRGIEGVLSETKFIVRWIHFASKA